LRILQLDTAAVTRIHLGPEPAESPEPPPPKKKFLATPLAFSHLSPECIEC